MMSPREDSTTVPMDQDQVMATAEDPQVLQEKIINEEYKIWKKNAPYLYDLVVTHALEWPSLTVQWFPDVERPEGKGYSVKRLLLGTHTSDNEQNYLQIATVHLPNGEEEVDGNRLGDGGEFGGHSSGNLAQTRCRVSIVQKIPHDGEVNRARYMPQNPCVIATKTVSGQVHIFDYTKHPSMPSGEAVAANPDLRLVGQTGEGYGLEWSPVNKGHLLSASSDSTVCLWDVQQGGKANKELKPLSVFSTHDGFVEDVSWSPQQSDVFVSVGDDRVLAVWDKRQPGKPEHRIANAHSAEINTVAFSPSNQHILATGSADRTVSLWDVRNLKASLHSLIHSSDDVLQLAWSPHHSSILASSGADRRVHVWDLDRIGMQQSAEDAEDGPPELLFVHGGHTNRVPDISWDPNTPWLMCSIAEDNICQIWQMTSSVYEAEEDDDMEEGDYSSDGASDGDDGSSASGDN